MKYVKYNILYENVNVLIKLFNKNYNDFVYKLKFHMFGA